MLVGSLRKPSRNAAERPFRIILYMKQSQPHARTQDGRLRSRLASFRPFVESGIGQATREIKRSQQIVRSASEGFDCRAARRHGKLLRGAGKNIGRRQLRGGAVVVSIPTVRVSRGSNRGSRRPWDDSAERSPPAHSDPSAGADIVCESTFKRFLVEAQPHILCGNVQHAVGIVGEVGEIGLLLVLREERAERKACQPLSRHGIAPPGISPAAFFNRNQFLQGSQIVRSSAQASAR